MPLFKTLLLSNHAKALLKTQNPLYKSLPPLPPFIIRTLNSSSHESTKKPLSLLFQDAVGLTESSSGNESQNESEGENNELIRELRKLEREVRKLEENQKGKKKEKEGVERGKPEKAKSLVELFGGVKKEEDVVKKVKVKREKEEVVVKDLSHLAEIFVRHLYAKGYFNKANFLEDKKLDFGYLDNSYGRDIIKYAAFKFGNDHQEIAKWLSGNHLKKVLLFGCPSLHKNNIFAAKRLRKFFKIQENMVCSQCMLKDSCKYVNNGVWGVGTKSLVLVDVMKVITLYALDQVPPKLTVSDKVKKSVN